MTALAFSGSFAQVDPTHVAEVGPAAAILFARITWRTQDAGEWRATRSELAAETGLSQSMIRTATEVLREREWVTTRRTSTLDSTLIWAPIHAGQAERRNPPSRDSEIRTTPPAESAIPSIETGKDITPIGPPPDDQALLPAPPAKARRKPKTAYPDTFRPSQSHHDKARELGVDLTHEGPKFRDYHQAHDSRYADWGAALHLWIRNAARFAAERQPVPHLRAVPDGSGYDAAYAAALPPPVTEPRAWTTR